MVYLSTEWSATQALTRPTYSKLAGQERRITTKHISTDPPPNFLEFLQVSPVLKAN